jgi:hypothetical protein
MLETPETETIGRLPHLLTHVSFQLPGLAVGADTYEDIRKRYGAAMSVLDARGQGRVTAPRAGVGSAHRYWSSTRDLVKELQRLGWVEVGLPVPSSKQAVDAYRDRRYPITDEGRRVATLIDDRRGFADAVTDAALAAHAYLRQTLSALDRGPVFCPETSEGQIQRTPSRRHWAEHGVLLLKRSDPLAEVTVEGLDHHLANALRKRFGRRREEGLKPSAKEVSEAMNDALADAALEARGLMFGATTMDQLTSWGMELRVLDQSRYVPGHEGGNLIWLACDLRRGGTRLHARRRTYTTHGTAVANALVDAYRFLRERRSGDDDGKQIKSAYQPIHVVRAAAAFSTGTVRELGDRVLEAMTAGALQRGTQVRLLAARHEIPPRSEPIYQRGGTRCLMLTMNPAHDGDA